MHWIAVALGGAAGAAARYGVGLAVIGRLGDRLPYGTWAVNGAGCFLMGFLWAVGEALPLGGPAKAFLSVGFLGALTTFSTYSLETVHFLRNQEWRPAALNALGSAAVGILMVYLGIRAAQGVFRGL